MDQKYYQDFEGRMTYMSPIIESHDYQQSPSVFGGEVKNTLDINIYDYSIQQQRHKSQMQDEISSHSALFQGQNLSDANVNMQISTSNHNPISTLQSIQSDKNQQQQYANMLQNSQALVNNNTNQFQQNIEPQNINYNKPIGENHARRENRLSFQPTNQDDQDLDAFAEQIEHERNVNKISNDNSQFIMSQLEKDCNNFSQIKNQNKQMNGSVPAGFVSPYVGMFSENFAKSASKKTPFDSIENNIINLEQQIDAQTSSKGMNDQSFRRYEQRSRATTATKIRRSSSQKSDKVQRETLLNNNFDYIDGPENKVVHTHTDIQERPTSNLRGSRGSSHSLKRSIQKSRGAFNRCSSNSVQIVRNAYINVQNSNNPFQELIKDCLVKFAEQQGRNILSERMLNQINLNQSNKLLSVIDAGLQDNQLQFLLEVVDNILESNGSDPNQNFNEDLVIKGINLNSNIDLTDNSLKTLTEFVLRHKAIKVLSVERFKVSHSSLTYLFQMLPETKIVELNISGIPLSYFCIDLLCQILYNQRRHIDLRVLHMRNTKLQDVSALKLFQYIFGSGLSEPIKIRYLSMSMNNTLGYKFQNGVVKMFQDHKGQFTLKYLDIKFCNLTQQNIQIIQKIIQQNNELNIKDKSGGKCSLSSLRSAQKATIKQSSRFAAQSRSQKKLAPNKQPAPDVYHQAFEKRQNMMSNLRRSYEPYLSKPNELQNALPSQGSGEMVINATKNNLMQSLPGLNSMGTLYKQEGLFQQTENDVNNKLRDSTTEIMYTDQKGFSRSCNSRQPKSQSLQEIFTRGNDRTNTSLQNVRSQSSNTANQNVRSSVFSQNLIDNLNTFDLLNDAKGIKNISSKQLILQSVNQLIPQMQPSQTNTDQNLNLNPMPYKVIEHQSEQEEKMMMDQTFQKMNMQAYTDHQNQSSQMIPTYSNHLENTNQQFGMQFQSNENDQAYGNNITNTNLDPYSNLHSSTGGNLSNQFSQSQISSIQNQNNLPINIHQQSMQNPNHFRMFSSQQNENFTYHNRKSSIKSLGSISGSISSSNNNTIKTDHNQPQAAIAKINLLDLQRKSHNDMEKLKGNNRKKTRSIDSKSRRSGSFTRYGSLPKQRLITKAAPKAKSVKSNKSAGSKKGQMQDRGQMKFNRSTKSHNIIGERMLNLCQNNPKKGTQGMDLASNITTLVKSQKNDPDSRSNDRYSNEQSAKNAKLSTKRNSMTLLERQRLSLESIGSRQNYINRDFRSIQYQPQQQAQSKLSFRPTCSQPHLDAQDVRNLSQQRLKKLQQNQLFKQQQQAMKKPKYINKQQEMPQQHHSQFIVRDIDMENRYLRESRLLNTNDLLKSSASYNSNKIMNINLNQVQENAGYINNQSQIHDFSQLSSIQSQFPLLDQSQLYENNNFQQPIQLDSRKNTQNSRKELTTNSSYHHLGQQFGSSDDPVVVGEVNQKQHQMSYHNQMNAMQNPSIMQQRLNNINYLNFQQPPSQPQANISLSSIQTTMPSSILNSNRGQVGRFKQPKYIKNKFMQNGRKNSGSRDFQKCPKMNSRSRETAKNKAQQQRQQAATKYVQSKNSDIQSCPNYSTENVKLSLADLMSLQKQQEMLQKKRGNYCQNNQSNITKFYDNNNNSLMVNQSTASWNHDLSYLSHQVRANNYIPPNMHKDEIFTGGAECMPINSKNYSMRSEMPVPSMTNRTNITNHTNLTHQTNHTNSTNRINHVNNHLNQVIVGNPSPHQQVSQQVSNLGTRMESITYGSAVNSSCPNTCKNHLGLNSQQEGFDEQGHLQQRQRLQHVQRFPSNHSRNQFQTIVKDDDKTYSSRQQRAKKSTGQKKGLLSQRQLNDRSGRIISRSTNDLNRNPDSSYKQPVIMPSISRSNSNMSKTASNQNQNKGNTPRRMNPELGTHFSEEQLLQQQAAYYQYNNVPIGGAYSQMIPNIPTDERDNTKSCSSLTTSHPSQHQQIFANNGQHIPMNSMDNGKKEEFCDLRNMIMSEITRLQSLYKKIDDYMVVEGGNPVQNQQVINHPNNYNDIHKTIPRGHKQVCSSYQDFY